MSTMQFKAWTYKPRYRKRREDEQFVYDRKCKVCNKWEMIGKWSWSRIKYVSFRCSDPECDYGNE